MYHAVRYYEHIRETRTAVGMTETAAVLEFIRLWHDLPANIFGPDGVITARVIRDPVVAVDRNETTRNTCYEIVRAR